MQQETKQEQQKEEVSVEENSPFLNKKTLIRILVSVIAVLITVTFFVLSWRFCSMTTNALIIVAIVCIAALATVALFRGWETIYKLCITAFYIGAVFLIIFFALNKSAVLSSIDSAEDLVRYINNSGGVAEVLFVVINFLQVTIVPIPSTITTTAGAILFDGIWKPLYLTVIGLVIGSMFAFFLGRVLGVRFANWLVGEKAIKKYRDMTKGRDKVVLFYMFIFPFFPDDLLCILAGMTDYTYPGFFLLQVFSRTIGTLTTILIAKGVVSIPFYGWWILLWVFIIALVIVLLVLTIKYSDKIEGFILKIIHKLPFGKGKEQKQDVEAEAACSAVSSVTSGDASHADPPDQGEENVH